MKQSGFNAKEKAFILKTAENVRTSLLEEERKQGKEENNLMGKCIKVSDTIAEILQAAGYQCESIQCWCLYEDWENCPEVCYEEHWVNKITKNEDTLYIDATCSQFQWAFFEQLPDIYVGKQLPNFFLKDEPNLEFLRKIGWENYYVYGDGGPNFDFGNYAEKFNNNSVVKLQNAERVEER